MLAGGVEEMADPMDGGFTEAELANGEFADYVDKAEQGKAGAPAATSAFDNDDG